MKHILVTGAAGFIGSHLVDKLLCSGVRVTAIDSLDNYYSPQLKRHNLIGAGRNENFSFIEVDIRYPTFPSSIGTSKYDGLVHLAAKAGVRPSIEDPNTYQEVNILGTQNVMNLAKALRIPVVVFASSSSVYGLNPSVPWSEDDHQLKPISPYAVTKLAGEFMGHVHSCLGDFRFMALRFFTVYGPRQRPDLAIAKITRLMKQGLPVPMYGDGSTERDYTYIDDIVEGIILSLGYNRTPFEVINIGNNQTISLNDMVSGIESALGVVAHRRYGAMQPGDVPKTYACIKKAQELLGYSPKTKFADGLRSYVKWVSDNEDILRDS